MQEAGYHDGVARYAHCTGDVSYRRQYPFVAANTMAFVLNKKRLTGSGYKPKEEEGIHEILSWGRIAGNNRILMFFGTAMEAFQNACDKLMGRFESVLPKGCLKARIRYTKRESRDAPSASLGDTLGSDATGYVIVDAAGAPMKYDMLSVMQDMSARQWSRRLELDVPSGPRGKGWRSTRAYVDTGSDEVLDETWKREMESGCKHLLEESFVSSIDAHLDAKIWPTVHPYATGSVFSEIGSGGVLAHCQNRLMLIQSWFRKNSFWAFWMMNRQLKQQLFHRNLNKRRAGRGGGKGGADNYEEDIETKLFGTVIPSTIPESPA